MAYRDDCPYGEQWKNGVMLNPKRKGNSFFADIYLSVRSKSAEPADTQIATHHGTEILCSKRVEINEERYNELMAKKK